MFRNRDLHKEIARLQLRILQLQEYLDASLALLYEYGWTPFGTHGNSPAIDLRFSPQTSEDGLPYFEKVVAHGAPD